MCPAIFTGLVFDTDKSVKPCCAYGDNHAVQSYSVEKKNFNDNNNDFGVLSDNYRLKDILESKERKRLQKEARNNELSPGCTVCERRYKVTGQSQKTTWLRPEHEGGNKGFHDGWETNITVIEVNHSNTCNLSCAACNSFFSSAWLKYEEMSPPDPIRHLKSPPTTSFDIVSHLKEIDLTKLKTLVLKGGEPMMNPDLLPLLQYFSDINVLSNLLIVITSNGTILGKEIDAVRVLLSEAKLVKFSLSVDGTGAVGTYIRYSPQQFAKISNIEAFIQSFTEHTNTRFVLFPSIQVYNIFSLDKIVDWWDIMIQKHKNVTNYVELNHFVLGPQYLSIGALQPATIEKIIQYYKNKNDERYDKLIVSLKKIPYMGDEIHNKMVKYTLEMDKIKGQNVFESVPELADEMIIR
jgi:organic radical activating enzyme